MKKKVLLFDIDASRKGEIAGLLASNDYDVASIDVGAPDMSQYVSQYRPDIVVINTKKPGPIIIEQLQSISEYHPCPVVIFAESNDSEMIRELVNAGVSAYVVDGISASRIKPILETAVARHQQYASLQNEVVKLKSQLNERKLIDRAKGILMEKKGLAEQEAYQQLRQIAMNANKKMIDIAEYIIASADTLL